MIEPALDMTSPPHGRLLVSEFIVEVKMALTYGHENSSNAS